MNMQDRITYSNEQMLAALAAAMDQLKKLRYDSRYQQHLGDRFIKKLNDWENLILRRRDDPFTLVVIGDFKRGKSTFINALLGEEVVTTDVTTETVTMNRIRYGAHSNEAVLSGSRRAQLGDSELKREALEGILKEFNEPVTALELKRPIELLKKVTIIDTPGTGDAMREFSDVVKDSLVQADAVVYLYNVRYPLSLSEQLFLRSAVLPQKYTSLFLVGNYADLLESEAEYDKLRAVLQQRVSALLPNEEVYMVSALDELDRQLGEHRRDLPLTATLESQFDAVRERLTRLIEEKADTVVLDRMQRLSAALVADLSKDLEAIERGLHMTEEERRNSLHDFAQEKDDCIQRQTALLREVEERTSAMKEQTLYWMGEFAERLVKESAELSKETSETIRQYYEMFCIDRMQLALNICLEYHQDQLYDWLDSISSTLSGALPEEFAQLPAGSFRFHLDNRIWTRGDTAGLALSMVPSQGLLSTVASMAADGVAGFFREREANKKTDVLVSQISGNILALNISTKETVEKLYSSLCEKIKKLVIELWNEELENKEQLLHEAVQVSSRAEEEKAATQSAIQDTKAILNAVLEKTLA